ncbi:hypothetical protein CPB84DRAFT_831561 [Gymnopilus junonius]|uniref:Uncharacterized protein n=1 Tax=Gymnopilus junonius TaxID=109634 RepID=A0A9P5NMZ1_GYMJU|nr:hypothetical protein CPB84DRAFT_831561 [Gymnopilus junonius]
MFTLGHGFPMWEPSGNLARSEIHLKEGIRIGDMGLVTKEGGFTLFFNIFLSKTDPYQRRCPPEHEPLLPAIDPSEVIIDTTQFPRPSILTSNGILVSHLSDSPLDVTFTIRAREGGIIVLPDGASRENLSSTSEEIHPPLSALLILSQVLKSEKGEKDLVLSRITSRILAKLLKGQKDRKASVYH